MPSGRTFSATSSAASSPSAPAPAPTAPRASTSTPASAVPFFAPIPPSADRGSTTTKATRYIDLGSGSQAVQSNDGSITITVADHLGTGQLAIEAADLSLSQRRTLPFGGTRGTPTGTWTGSKGYVGGVDETKTTGLTHLGAREYDAAIGRFISADPIVDPNDPQQINGYAYSNNSPATFSDPSGLRLMCGGPDEPACPTRPDGTPGNGRPNEAVDYSEPPTSSPCIGICSTDTSDDGRQAELGRRAAAAYRLGLTLNPDILLNPNATQLVSMWFMGATPSSYQFGESDRMTQDVKRHIWMDVVRRYLSHRTGTKIGKTIEGLSYKTKYGAAMNELPLKGMMAGELADAVSQLMGDNSPHTSEGATRAALGSFTLKATVVGYNKLSNRGTVQFEITQAMTVESLTRDVSKKGYEAGAKDPRAVAISNAAYSVFPGGQKDLQMTFRWSETLSMPEPLR